MRVPNFSRYAHWLAGFGLFAAGAVIGSALFMALYQEQFTFITLQNIKLVDENNKLHETLESLRSARSREGYIWEINVEIEQTGQGEELDELTAAEIVRRVREDLKLLVGKPAAHIKDYPDLYRKIVDGTVYAGIRDRDYRIQFRMMAVIHSELTVRIAVQRQIPN